MLEEWLCEIGRDENMEMKFGIYKATKNIIRKGIKIILENI